MGAQVPAQDCLDAAYRVTYVASEVWRGAHTGSVASQAVPVWVQCIRYLL